MIRILRFEESHFRLLTDLEKTKYLKDYVDSGTAKVLETQKYSYTIFEDDKIIFCGGIIDWWKDRGEAWAVFNLNEKFNFLKIHNVVKRFFSQVPYNRIEAVVKCDFLQGHRWMRSLGFKMEASRLRQYKDKEDYSLYAKVKDANR